MSINESTKDKLKSDGASSDICIVDSENANSSGETACWKRSSPANSSANRNRNSSPTFINTPSPIPSPSPQKPISRLKRIILAPIQPNSPKRYNKEITIAIGKLRPVNNSNLRNLQETHPILNLQPLVLNLQLAALLLPVRVSKSASLSSNQTQLSL